MITAAMLIMATRTPKVFFFDAAARGAINVKHSVYTTVIQAMVTVFT